MGHHSPQITVGTYGHLIPGAIREAVNRLAAMVEISATSAQPGSRVEQIQERAPSSNIMNNKGN